MKTRSIIKASTLLMIAITIGLFTAQNINANDGRLHRKAGNDIQLDGNMVILTVCGISCNTKSVGMFMWNTKMKAWDTIQYTEATNFLMDYSTLCCAVFHISRDKFRKPGLHSQNPVKFSADDGSSIEFDSLEELL